MYAWYEQLQPVSRPFVMDVGDIGHKCLEAYYTGLDYLETLAKVEEEAFSSEAADDEFAMEMFLEAHKVVATVMPHYIEYSQRYDPDLVKKILAVEQRYEVPIPSLKSYQPGAKLTFGKTTLSFKVDMIIRTPQGGVYLWENKFVKQAPGGYEYLEYDEQTHTYLWGLRQVGFKNIEGIVFNLIRHKPTKKEPDKWIIRDRTYRTPEQLDMVGYELAIATAERNRLRVGIKRDEDVIHRVMMRGCTDCTFRQLCLGELKALDMSILRQERFAVREQRR